MPRAALLLAASLLAAGPAAAPRPALAAAPVDPPLDPRAACPDWRWIGVRPNALALCPAAAGWSAASLFDPLDGTAVPPALAPFCLYEWSGSPPARFGLLLDLERSGELLRVDPDCMAVAPAAGLTLADQVAAPLAAQFLAQAGDAALPLGQGATRTRLALLDTGATNEQDPEAQPGNSPHGYSLAQMAAELLCPGECLADLTARLAMPYLTFDPADRSASVRDDVDGGYLGTIGELAQVLRGEVHDWELDAADPTPARRLVLNLSLAWDSRFGGREAVPAEMPAPVEAVYRAIEDAVCRGAVVVAAAGNLHAGPDPALGPLLPGGWEQRAAPDLGACEIALGLPPEPGDFPPAGATPYRPLVHAAGGIQGGGDPLATARPLGEPRLAGFADHATVLGGPPPAATLTGSSVASLVAASATAAVWYYRPDLRADLVLAGVHAAGDSLGRRADFCLGGSGSTPCPLVVGFRARVRRASVCAAAVAACTAGGGFCPPAADFPTCPAWPAPAPDLSLVDLPGATAVDFNLLTTPFPPDPACGPEQLQHDAGYTPADPCPHRQYHDGALEAWVGPQPGSNPCPNCSLVEPPALGGGAATLFLEIDPAWTGSLTDATLKIGDATYNLSLAGLAPAAQVEVAHVDAAGRHDLLLTLTRTVASERQSAVVPLLMVP